MSKALFYYIILFARPNKIPSVILPQPQISSKDCWIRNCHIEFSDNMLQFYLVYTAILNSNLMIEILGKNHCLSGLQFCSILSSFKQLLEIDFLQLRMCSFVSNVATSNQETLEYISSQLHNNKVLHFIELVLIV